MQCSQVDEGSFYSPGIYTVVEDAQITSKGTNRKTAGSAECHDEGKHDEERETRWLLQVG